MKKDTKIQILIDRITSGNFNDSDVKILFIDLRSDFFDEPVLYDLSSFVAHNSKRNQGLSFNHVNSYVMNFIKVSENGGVIFGYPSVFQSRQIMNLLAAKLKKLNFKFDENKLKDQKDRIIDSLQELMDETDLELKDPRVIRCYLRKDKNRVAFCMKLNLEGPFIKTSPNAIISSNLFD